MTCTHRDVSFTNAAGEQFHLAVFGPSDAEVAARGSRADGLPVLFCVHGAGMSGESFFRLARMLRDDVPPSTAGRCSNGGAAASPPLSPSSSSALCNEGLQVRSAGPLRPPPPRAPTQSRLAKGPLFAGQMPDPHAEDVELCVVTYDQRCHGASTRNGGEESLTLDVLVRDFQEVLTFVKESLYPRSQIFIVGHSVGGSVVVHGLRGSESRARVGGIVLIDVVEGTAMHSLRYMHEFLKKRPDSFQSPGEAEKWFLLHGGMHSPEGAAVSVPPLLSKEGESRYVWRTDLHKMEAVWDTWFVGMDDAFIAFPNSKMLCLANAERLDTTLTVAQMQGKFQFEIIGNNCGHYVMDDATVIMCSKLRRFVKRIVSLTEMLKCAVAPGLALHFNNTTVPPSRQE